MVVVVTVFTPRPPAPSSFSLWWRRIKTDRGSSAVEYGLLIAGIAALIAIAVFAFGGGVGRLFTDTCDEVTSAAGTASC